MAILSCTSPKLKINQPSISKKIVLIIERDDSVDIGKPNTIIECDDFTDNMQIFHKNHTVDTLIFEPTDGNIFVESRNNSFNLFTFYFERGDSARITIKNDIPFCNILNKKATLNDYSYSLGETKRLKKDNLSKYRYEGVIYGNYIPIRNQKNALDALALKLYRVYCIRQNYLDSIYKTKQISEKFYSFYKNNIRYSFLNSCYFIPSFITYTKPYTEKIIAPSDFSSEDAFNSVYYLKFLTSYVGYEMVGDKQSPFFDAKIAYDSVYKSSVFSQNVKNRVLIKLLSFMKRESNPNLQLYYQRFISQLKDSMYLAHTINYFAKDSIPKNRFSSTQSAIVDKWKRTTSIDSLISSFKGKLVYVDLWASWCAPCLASMPHSTKLRNEYQRKDVVFLYISLDKSFSPWLNANNRVFKGEYTYSYLLQNPKSSKWLEGFGVKEIPHYLLYARNGKILSSNAPSPEGKEIRELLNKYLAE